MQLIFDIGQRTSVSGERSSQTQKILLHLRICVPSSRSLRTSFRNKNSQLHQIILEILPYDLDAYLRCCGDVDVTDSIGMTHLCGHAGEVIATQWKCFSNIMRIQKLSTTGVNLYSYSLSNQTTPSP